MCPNMKKLRDFYEKLYQYDVEHFTKVFRDVYDVGGTRGTRLKLIIDFMEDTSSTRILDVGCGIGYNLAMLTKIARARNYVVGIDISLGAIKVAKRFLRNAKKCYLLVTDAQLLPFKEETFDLVICSEVLEHLPDDQRSISEMARILEKGGEMIISVPVSSKNHGVSVAFQIRGVDIGGDLRNYNFESLSSLLQGVGLRIETFSYLIGPFYDVLYKAYRILMKALLGQDIEVFKRKVAVGSARPRGLLWLFHKTSVLVSQLLGRVDMFLFKKTVGRDLIVKAVKVGE